MSWKKNFFTYFTQDKTVFGDDGDDYIKSYFGDDTLFGGGGNDFISSWGGENILDGGSGHDIVLGGKNSDTVIHNVSDNIGFDDFASGGWGYDTLVVQVTAAQFNEIQATTIQEDFENLPSSKFWGFGHKTFFDFGSYDLSFDFNLVIHSFEKLEFEITTPVVHLIKTTSDDETMEEIGSASVASFLAEARIDLAELQSQLGEGEVLRFKITGIDSGDWYKFDPTSADDIKNDLTGVQLVDGDLLSLEDLLVYQDNTKDISTFDGVTIEVIKVDETLTEVPFAEPIIFDIGLYETTASQETLSVVNGQLNFTPLEAGVSEHGVGDINEVNWLLYYDSSGSEIDGGVFETGDQILSTEDAGINILVGDVNNFIWSLKGIENVSASAFASASASIDEMGAEGEKEAIANTSAGSVNVSVDEEIEVDDGEEIGIVVSAEAEVDIEGDASVSNAVLTFGDDTLNGGEEDDLLIGDVNSFTWSLMGGSHNSATASASASTETNASVNALADADVGDSVDIYVDMDLEAEATVNEVEIIVEGDASVSNTVLTYGNDTLNGGDGQDTLIGDVNSFTWALMGGSHNSIEVLDSSASAEMSVNISAEALADMGAAAEAEVEVYLDAFAEIDAEIETDVDATVSGSSIVFGDDELNGGDGNDRLTGDVNTFIWSLIGGSHNAAVAAAPVSVDTGIILEAEASSEDSALFAEAEVFGGASAEVGASVGAEIESADASVSNVMLTFGNDTLNGEEGNDIIIGDVNSFTWSLMGGSHNTTDADGGVGGDLEITSNENEVGPGDASATATGDLSANADNSVEALVAADASVSNTALTFGNDDLNGGDGNDTLIGDIDTFTWSLMGGSDNSADAYAELEGNTPAISSIGVDSAISSTVSVSIPGITFGDDALSGGDGDDTLIGDLNAFMLPEIEAENNSSMANVSGGGAASIAVEADVFHGVLLSTTGSSLITYGNDFLDGGAGNDTLVGDIFNDITDGSGTYGEDTFFFDLSSDFGEDTIVDFGVGDVGDILQFAGLTDVDEDTDIDIDDIDALLQSFTDGGVGGDVVMDFGAGIGQITFTGIGTGTMTSVADFAAIHTVDLV